MPDAEADCCECGCGHGHEPDPRLIDGPSCVMCKWCQCSAHDQDFYENDEPIEVIQEIRKEEPEFITEAPPSYTSWEQIKKNRRMQNE